MLQMDSSSKHSGSGWSEIVQLEKSLSIYFKQSSYNLLKIGIGSDQFYSIGRVIDLQLTKKWLNRLKVHLTYLFPHKFIVKGVMNMCMCPLLITYVLLFPELLSDSL